MAGSKERAYKFIDALSPTRKAQRKYDLVYTDDKEQRRTDEALEHDDPYNRSSPGEGYSNGPQETYSPAAEPELQPTQTPELVMQAGMTLRTWLRQGAPEPNSLKELGGEHASPGSGLSPPVEIDTRVWLEEYARDGDDNKFEDLDVITD